MGTATVFSCDKYQNIIFILPNSFQVLFPVILRNLTLVSLNCAMSIEVYQLYELINEWQIRL